MENERVKKMAIGYFLSNGTMNLATFGYMLSSYSAKIRSGQTLNEDEIGAMECIAGSMIGESMLTHSMCIGKKVKE